MESTVKSDFAYIKGLDQSLHYAFQSAWEKSQKKVPGMFSLQKRPFFADTTITSFSQRVKLGTLDH